MPGQELDTVRGRRGLVQGSCCAGMATATRGGLVRAETGEAGIEHDVTGAGRPVILLHG